MNRRKIFYLILLVGGMGYLWRHGLETAVWQNGRAIRLNQHASVQTGTCRDGGGEVARIPAAQFRGRGFLQTGKDDKADTPAEFFKIFSSHTISVTSDVTPGSYQLHIWSKHAQPGPVLLQVWANDSPLGTLAYADDDKSWSEQCLRLTPLHWREQESLIISIRFANDGGPQGARDASIGRLRITTFLQTHENEASES